MFRVLIKSTALLVFFISLYSTPLDAAIPRFNCKGLLVKAWHFISQKAPQQKRAIVIIDPFGHNAGELLHNYALEEGVVPIFVFSTPLKEWPKSFHRFSNLGSQFPIVEHDGQLKTTLDNITSIAHQKNLKIVGALPGLEGPAVYLFDSISSALKIPSNGTEQSRARIQKASTQLRLKELGIPYIDKAHIGLDDPLAFEKIISFSKRLFEKGKTVILKPNYAAATTYIFRCKNESELREAYTRVKTHPFFLHRQIKSINIEERLIGNEYIYDSVRTTVIRDGKPHTLSVLTGVWKYNRAPSADPLQTDIIDTVEWIPANEIPQGLREYAEKNLDALQIKFGPTHLEIFETANGFRLIDFNARLPGSSTLISSEATGNTRNQVKMSVESVVDPEAFYKKYKQENTSFYKTAQYGLVLHLNVYEKGRHANLNRLADLKQRFGNILYESKVFPQDMTTELPLTVDLFTPLIKIHLLGSKEEVKRVAQEIKADHSRGYFYLPN